MLKIAILCVVVAIFTTACAEIVRPCSFDNYKCIANNLRANSRCNSNVKGFLPAKYIVEEFRFETPYFNSTYIDKNLIVKNHHKCFVSEFFLNPDTNTAVLTIDCPNLDLESDRVLIQHRSKREDRFYFYHFHAYYPLIRITVNLHGHMDLCRSHVYTEVCQLPRFNVRPKDKRTENFLSRDLTPLMIFERESFYYGGDRLAKVFIDYLICNYGFVRVIIKSEKWTLGRRSGCWETEVRWDYSSNQLFNRSAHRAQLWDILDFRTANFLTKDMSLLDIFERENFFYRGYPLIRIFVDTLLCDFNCKPHIQ